MQSNTKFITQAILHYVDSVMKRQNITHIMSACSILVKRQYRKCHEKVETYVHLFLRKNHHFQCSNKWYKHTRARTHAHTHTNHNQSREMTNIKSFGISIFKQIKLQMLGHQTQLVQQAKQSVRLLTLLFLMTETKSSRNRKKFTRPGLNNRITESLEYQGSGHTGSYRCSRREQVMLKRTHQYIKQIDTPADIISIQKAAILGTAYILRRKCSTLLF